MQSLSFQLEAKWLRLNTNYAICLLCDDPKREDRGIQQKSTAHSACVTLNVADGRRWRRADDTRATRSGVPFNIGPLFT